MMNSVRHQAGSKPMAAPPAQLHTHKNQKLVELRDIGHCISLMDYLNNLRLRNELCDVKFIVNNKEFYGHRVILSSASSYFEGMFIGMFNTPQRVQFIQTAAVYTLHSHANLWLPSLYMVFDRESLVVQILTIIRNHPMALEGFNLIKILYMETQKLLQCGLQFKFKNTNYLGG